MKAVKYKENLRPSSGPGHVRRPGHTDGPGYTDVLMGLSVAGQSSEGSRRTQDDVISKDY